MARTAPAAGREFATYVVEHLRRGYLEDPASLAMAKRRFGGWDIDSVIIAALSHVRVAIDEHGTPVFDIPRPRKKHPSHDR